MRDFFTWFREGGADSRPWLILGKGPSFERRRDFDLTGFRLLSLNHAVRELPVEVAHIIDLDVVDACGPILAEHARFVLMPWIPHVNNRPGSHTLEEIARSHPLLGRLAAAARLLWYNLSTGGAPHGSSPVVPVRFFSAEAALNLLVAAGVRRVRSLGVDGGGTYASAFTDLSGKTLLANGRTSFDRQFESIARTIARTGVDFAPLDIEAPIRVFVGAMPDQSIPVRVLEFSIRQHASMTVQVTPICDVQIDVPLPRDPASRPRTPFSFQRFLIPQAAGHRGRAIYLDSDMQVFRDIRELWTWPMGSAPLLSAFESGASGRRPQFSVMLLDCGALDWKIADIVAKLDRKELDYERLMYKMEVAPGFRAEIPSRWNSLERYEQDETALLHFTDMNTQPWLYTTNPRAYLWCRELFAAIDAGFMSIEEIEAGVAATHVRPSLLEQVRRRIEDPLLLPKEIQQLDRSFTPPHARGNGKGSAHRASLARRVAARLRSTYEGSVVHELQQRLRDRRR